MTSASVPMQRPANARLLEVDSRGHIRDMLRSSFPTLLRSGDIVVANDAATLPASIFGVHERTGRSIEVRLAGSKSMFHEDVRQFSAVVFGEGSYRTPTEHRPSPPELHPGDKLQLGPLTATVLELLGHARFVLIRFQGPSERIWEGLARHGHAIQYSHVPIPLAVWDTWTPIASLPAAFEPPSAGFVLNWHTLDAIHRLGVDFATITHAAGISSTGDAELDARLPFDEPYRITESAARSIRRTRAVGGRLIAIGTTVVRALEHAVSVHGLIKETTGVATNKIGPATELCVVDAILSGAHEPGTSHHKLLSAFVDQQTLAKMDEILRHHAYRTHEFGDSVFVEKSRNRESSIELLEFGPRHRAAPEGYKLQRPF